MIFSFVSKNIGKVVNPSNVKEWEDFGCEMDKAFFEGVKTVVEVAIKQNKINKKRR